MKVLKVLAWIVGTPLILFGLLLFARFVSCGPNSADVKVATPMVEKIADYIVEHGVPDSLSDIPNLPYRLEGCGRKIVYWNNNKIVKTIKDSTWKEIFLSCYFIEEDKKYKIIGRFTAYTQNKENWEGNLDIRYEKTTVGTLLKSENGKLNYDGIATGFDNRFGFCAALKQ